MTKSSATRRETDSFGAIEVPAERLWGAQTQRSLMNFPIGEERMPRAVIHALGLVKQAAALTNEELGLLPSPLAQAIAAAAAEVAAGGRDDEFPLKVWQTGSGTQTNMNVNEVIADLANERLGGRRGDKSPIHPNDHVNLGQSSNDLFPSAMHISAALAILSAPAAGARAPHEALAAKSAAFAELVKIGRTHLQDATPITLGQEFSGWAAQVELGRARVEATLPGLLRLGAGRDGGRHGAQRRPALRRTVRAPRRGAHRPAVRLRRQQVRGDRRSRRFGLHAWRAFEPRRGALQDRLRHPPARLWAAQRLRRASRCRRTSRARRSCPARSIRPRSKRCAWYACRRSATERSSPSPTARATSSSTR